MTDHDLGECFREVLVETPGREWERVRSMESGRIRLRLGADDGSPAREYRIENGSVEVRTLYPEGVSVRRAGSVWEQLTPEQLSGHVERNTAVAQWLERRLGWRRLLQACVTQEPSRWEVSHNTAHPPL